MESWIEQELLTADFGDRRLSRRLCTIVEQLSRLPRSTVPEASGSWAATKAAYNFWDSERVSAEQILAPHHQATLKRSQAQSRILAIQDTTKIEFTHHPATSGLGYLSVPHSQGIHVHTTLAASVTGVPLGIIAQEQWIRPKQNYGKRSTRKKRSVAEKESRKWLTALTATHALIDKQREIVTCCDREADFWELFAAKRPANSHLLIRVAQNRRVAGRVAGESERLFSQVQLAPFLGRATITIGHSGSRPAREAVLTISAMPVELLAPQSRKNQSNILVWLVLAEEEHPPEGVWPARWLLLTTLPIETFENALECVKYYSCRWLVERYHYTLKSGCQVESLQLETAQRLQKAVATYCIVAWRLLWLLYHERTHPDDSCETILEPYQWQALYCTHHNTTTLPKNVPTLQQAVLWIAILGGFLARNADGKPGVKTLWRGWRRLTDIADTWKLAKSIPNNHPRTYG